MNGPHHGKFVNPMEQWELGPGVIGDGNAASVAASGSDDSEIEHGEYSLRPIPESSVLADTFVIQGTAFSSVHIDSSPAGIKFENVHFQLLHIAPGTVNAPYSTVAHNRLCSVAIGKIHVKAGSKEFAIEAHGIWRIRPGQECSVSNPYYSEAIVHVSTFQAGDIVGVDVQQLFCVGVSLATMRNSSLKSTFGLSINLEDRCGIYA
jgi:hypothetical protein